MSKRLNTIIICIVGIMVFGYLMTWFFSLRGTEYELNDCVTYFDDKAKIQLLRIGDDYWLLDAEQEKSISPKIKKYMHIDDCVYAVCENGFLTFDVLTGEKNIKHDIYEFDKDSQYVFKNCDMIDLTKKRNQFMRYFSKFIPYNIRKW